MSMGFAGRRARGAVGSRLVRAALLGGCVVPVLLSVGVATASARTNPCTSAPTPVTSVPTNPFGANVTIFDPSMSVASINAALNATPPAGGGKREFFFLPGTYGDPSVTPATATTSNVIQAEVAPGTVVAGVGKSPCDVVINGALSINNGFLAIRDSQMSNLTINPIQANVPAGGMLWYTSQTATLRRVNILGDLYVSPVTQTPGACETPCNPVTQGFQINVIPGVANGFVITNSVITGKVINGDGLNRPGTEGNGGNSDIYFQQDDLGGYSGFGSDMVFSGTLGAPSDNFGPGSISPYAAPGDITNVTFTPVVREAPFVYYDGRQFRVFRPSAQSNVRGPNWSTAARQGDSLPLSSFYIATVAAGDDAETMNAALASGKNLLLGPGTYVLDAPLTIAKPDKVVMGLGDPILRADNTATLVVKLGSGYSALQVQRRRPRVRPGRHGTVRRQSGRDRRHASRRRLAEQSDGADRRELGERVHQRVLARSELHDPEPGRDPDQQQLRRRLHHHQLGGVQREHRRHRQRGPQHLAGHLARALQEDRDHMER